jgi:drug/metabolite transporter (DMT)-like permease
MSLAPVFATTIAYAVLHEKLRPIELLGILVTIGGVVWVILERHPPGDDAEKARHSARERRTGLLLALTAALLQAITAVIIKHATTGEDYHAFAMTQIRAIAAIPCFVLLVIVSGRVGDTVRSFRNRDAMILLAVGAVAGPFLGVSLFNESVKHVPTGVTQTLSALVPVMILPFAIYVMKERVTWRAALGAAVSVAGVALLAMGG